MTNGSQAPDLTAFLRAVFLAGEVALGLDTHDIELVEAAWSIPDAVASSHGWVLALKNGRRVYVEYTLDEGGARFAEELEMMDLRPGQTYPELEDNTRVFWYRPDNLNRHLGLRRPSLH
jgi:hypothetical protein